MAHLLGGIIRHYPAERRGAQFGCQSPGKIRELRAGFWSQTAVETDRLFADGFEN